MLTLLDKKSMLLPWNSHDLHKMPMKILFVFFMGNELPIKSSSKIWKPMNEWVFMGFMLTQPVKILWNCTYEKPMDRQWTLFMGFPQVFHGCDFMVYKPMKTYSFMGFPWVHYFGTAFHGYFITHEKITSCNFHGYFIKSWEFHGNSMDLLSSSVRPFYMQLELVYI